MAIAGLFNKAGYNKALDVTSRDVMAQLSMNTNVAPAPSESFQQGIPNPVFQEKGNADTYMDDLISGNDRKGTLMQTMYPDRDYKDTVRTSGLDLDVNKKVTTGEIVSREATGGMEAVQKQKASFKDDFGQAKAEATQMLKEAAKDMDIDPSEAVGQMVAKRAPSNAGVVTGALGGLAGGGSLATAGSAALYLKQELSKEDKKLPPKQQEALLADTLKRLQESRKPVDTRESASSGGKMDAAPAEEGLKKSEIAWEEMGMADLAELMKADPDGLDQPEMQNLMDVEHELEAVKLNHKYVEKHYADDASPDKIEASVKSGNGAMSKLVAGAQVLKIDAGDVSLAGAGVSSVAGGVTVASASDLDTGGIAKDMNLDLVNDAAVKEQLQGDIKAQFSA